MFLNLKELLINYVPKYLCKMKEQSYNSVNRKCIREKEVQFFLKIMLRNISLLKIFHLTKYTYIHINIHKKTL